MQRNISYAILLPVLFVSFVAFSGCGQGDASDSSAKDSSSNTNASAVSAGSETVNEVKITARQWQFDPSTITVKKGETVKLLITSEDVAHGFSLPDFNVSKTLSPGKVTEVTFVADKTGTFSFACSVQCGKGHTDMKGTLVVE